MPPVPKPTRTPKAAPRVLHGTGGHAVSPGTAARRRGVKTSVSVALDIVRDMVSQRLQAGDKLPLESELLKHYGVSRASLREGMRLLEVQGLLSIRPGPGGVVVGGAHPANLGRSLMLHMQFVGATYDELMDTCIWTEGQLAELAARNRDRKKVRRLMLPFLNQSEAHSAASGFEHPIEEGLNFHLAVGALVENRVRAFMLMMPGQVLVEHIISNVERKFLEDPFVHDHEAIAVAIIAGNATRAGKLMRDHFEHINKFFRTYWPRAVADRIQGR